MSEGYLGWGACRGGVLGTLLVWLVGAGTLAGFLVLLLQDPEVPSSGTPEEMAAEIAARTAPIGRLTLAEPPPEPAVQTSPGAVTPAATQLTDSTPATGSPPGSEAQALADPDQPDGAPVTAPTSGASVAVTAPASEPLPAGDQEVRQPVSAPPPPPSPSHWGGPYRLVPVPRPDLPGVPYQLVPLAPAPR